MQLKIHPENPEGRKIDQAVKILRKGGVIIYPTDSVYAFGCDLNSHKGMELLCRIKGIKPDQAKFSIVCESLSHISEFTKPISTSVFRLMKQCLPGPFTFILEANNATPKLFRMTKKREIGIRVPANQIILNLVEALGNPMVTTSIHGDDEILEYTNDPELIAEKYEKRVDLIIDGGIGNLLPSTIINCTEQPFIQRQGLGEVNL